MFARPRRPPARTADSRYRLARCPRPLEPLLRSRARGAAKSATPRRYATETRLLRLTRPRLRAGVAVACCAAYSSGILHDGDTAPPRVAVRPLDMPAMRPKKRQHVLPARHHERRRHDAHLLTQHLAAAARAHAA